LNGFNEIENQEEQRDDRIIDKIFQERLCGGCQKLEMLTVEYKRSYMPAHDEDRSGHTYKNGTYRIHSAKVLRCQEERIRAEGAHKIAIDRTCYNEPEKQQNLVLPQMQ
jgi:hypothetical protein